VGITIVNFHRYSSLGYVSILIDELKKCIIPERQKPIFAPELLDANYGVGGDELVFVQKPHPEVVKEIARSFPRYWSDQDLEHVLTMIEREQIDCLFRSFDGDGTELLTSGNGIQCAAAYLHENTDRMRFMMLAEIPTHRPRIKPVDCTWKGTYEVDMGPVIAPPSEFTTSEMTNSIDEDKNIFIIGPQKIDVEDRTLELTAFFLYVGEPHLIVFCGERQPSSYVETVVLDTLVRDFFVEGISEKNDPRTRENFFNQVGFFFNNPKIPLFPKGVNVNFVTVSSQDSLVLRTFERGVNKEVMASGTGVVACAYVAHKLKLLQSNSIFVEPKGAMFEIHANGRKVTSHQEAPYVHVKDDTLIFGGPVLKMAHGSLEGTRS
jgi:diaminopimelate epimerase